MFIVCLFSDDFEYIYKFSWSINIWYSVLAFCMCFQLFIPACIVKLFIIITVILFAEYFRYVYYVSILIIAKINVNVNTSVLICYLMILLIINRRNLLGFKLTDSFRYLYKVLCRMYSQNSTLVYLQVCTIKILWFNLSFIDDNIFQLIYRRFQIYIQGSMNHLYPSNNGSLSEDVYNFFLVCWIIHSYL